MAPSSDHVAWRETGGFVTVSQRARAPVPGLITFFAPCYTAGKNAEMVGEGCVLHCLLSLVPLLNIWCHANVRGKVRDQKKIDVSAAR